MSLSRAALGAAAEAAVVALAMSGEREAFCELVRRREVWVRGLLRRLCHDPTLADDLAQQVFLQAWRSLPALKAVGAFGAWLRRLAINAWLTHRRSAAAAAFDPLPDELPASVTPVPTPGERFDLESALAHLARDERLCVVLAYSEGMSHGEISAATSLPLGTVKSHIRRGTQRLRGLLHAYQPEEEKSHVG